MDGTALGAPVRRTAPRWRLKPAIAEDTQGIVASAYRHLGYGVALFLDASGAEANWLGALRRAAPVTPATGKDAPRSAAIALTASGLQRLGLTAEAIRGGFERPFWEGMHQQDRRRRLGDEESPPERSTVVAGGARWSGNPDVAPPGTVHRTPLTVHALLLLYDDTRDDLAAWETDVRAAAAGAGLAVVHALPLWLRYDNDQVAREHFGFADGISQPVPYSQGDEVQRTDGDPRGRDPWHGVPLGDILFGYLNGHDELAAGPQLMVGAGAEASLHPLGTHGSYLVVRELHQDVPAFWASMERAAAALGDPRKDACWVAERAVGREKDGDVLLPEGRTLPRLGEDGPDNDFGYFDTDRDGLGCPLGSHVRRANPRDGLAPAPDARQSTRDAVNNHRILRRGRNFGPPYVAGSPEAGAERGLLFMALNTDITRQFEVIQQTWILNSGFATLPGETDPLCGPPGPFTVQDQPLRRKLAVETFIRFAGGEYFFLPGIKALDWLEGQR